MGTDGRLCQPETNCTRHTSVKTRKYVLFAATAIAILASGCSATSAHSTTASSHAASATRVQAYTTTCPYDVTTTGNRKRVASQEATGLDPATLTITITATGTSVPCSVLPIPSGLSWARQPSVEHFQSVAESDQYVQANVNEVCGGQITGGIGIADVSKESYAIDDTGNEDWSQTMAIDTCTDLTGQSVDNFGGA